MVTEVIALDLAVFGGTMVAQKAKRLLNTKPIVIASHQE